MLPSITIAGIELHTFGLMLALAVLTQYWLARTIAQRHAIPVHAETLVFIFITTGLAGAKLDGAIREGWQLSSFTELGHALMRSGDLTFLGGFMAALLSTSFYLRASGIPVLRTLDYTFTIAPSYAIGRIGCFMAGDGDYGPPTSLPWGVSFPHGLVRTNDHVHPTMLYIAAWELLSFLLFWQVSKKRLTKPWQPGTLLAAYLITTSTGRFTFEFLSRNPKLSLGLTEAQWVSLALFITGAGLHSGLPLTCKVDRARGWFESHTSVASAQD